MTDYYFGLSTEAEMSAHMEPPKPGNRFNNIDNPSEMIKQAQKELVFNNSSNKEDIMEQQGKPCIVSSGWFCL